MNYFIIFSSLDDANSRQTISTSIHDDPPSIIAPSEILLDEEINDDFLRDATESIAQYYNFRYPGDVSMPYQMDTRWFNNVL